MNQIETVKLNNGVDMPLEGFGVFQVARSGSVRAGGLGCHCQWLSPH